MYKYLNVTKQLTLFIPLLKIITERKNIPKTFNNGKNNIFPK